MHIQSTQPPPAEGCIDTQVVGSVLLIGINRPAKRNGWTPTMFRQLAEAYTLLDDEPELHTGVLHAFGDHFTAGLDMPAIQAHTPVDVKLLNQTPLFLIPSGNP